MSTKSDAPRRLVLVTLLFIAFAALATPLATSHLEPWVGLLLLFVFYWLGLCLPCGLLFQRGNAIRRALDFRLGAARWVPFAILAQIGVIIGVSWALAPATATFVVVLIAAPIAMINGFCEEFFWRGAFLDQSQGRVGYLVLAVALFALWHAPLAMAQGVVYQGGSAALIGGAFALGAFWMIVAYRTQRIAWPILAHIVTNTTTFTGLFAVNFV